MPASPSWGPFSASSPVMRTVHDDRAVISPVGLVSFLFPAQRDRLSDLDRHLEGLESWDLSTRLHVAGISLFLVVQVHVRSAADRPFVQPLGCALARNADGGPHRPSQPGGRRRAQFCCQGDAHRGR